MDLLNIDYRKALVSAANAHKAATGRSIATIGNLIAKDKDFIIRIENGCGCTVDTFQKAMRWFEDNTPKSTKKRRTQ